jgi:serine/threonine protein kinase
MPLIPSGLASGRTRNFKSMRKVQELGQGIFGVVNLVEDPITHERIVAMTIKLSDSSESRSYDDFVEEIEKLIGQVHPCVVEIVGYSLPGASDDCCAIVGTKFASNGSLKKAIQDGKLDDTAIAIVVCGMVLGMQFIHSKDIVHGDLIPSNVLLDERGYARIGDAWISRLVDLNIALVASVGAPAYIAPEMSTDVICGKPADVYSFALILYELLVGKLAFNPLRKSQDIANQAASGVGPKLPESLNATVKEIIEKGWSVDPAVRCPFDEIWWCLASVDFQLTPVVDCSKVSKFLSWAGVPVPVPIPVPVAPPPVLPCRFLVQQEGLGPLSSLSFERHVTVAVVRGQVASHLNVDPANVQLLFGGRILRDPLVLDNLRIVRDDVIVVHVTEWTDYLGQSP